MIGQKLIVDAVIKIVKKTFKFDKVLDYVEFPAETMRLVMVDRDKQSGTDAEDGKNIHHVPTFILYKDGIELGRIVETPIESLEDDIFCIRDEPTITEWELKLRPLTSYRKRRIGH